MLMNLVMSKRYKCPRCDGTGTFYDGSRCYYCQGVGWYEA